MITDWKPSLFISSTMDELAMERKALKKVLEDEGMYTWLFERDAGAREYPIQQTYFAEIGACNIYIGLFWLKYGEYTIDEYNKARELNKPCLIYIRQRDLERRDQALTTFLSGIQSVTNSSGVTPCYFDTVEELTAHIAEDVERLLVKSGRLIDTENRQRMLTKVRNLWIYGVLEQSLFRKAPIVLDLQRQPDALFNPWRSDVQETDLPVQELSRGTYIIEVYDSAEERGLLILGEPGLGKTTLLLELTRDLLNRADQDKYHPIPLVFTLSTWATKRQPLAAWLVEEMKTKYEISSSTQNLIDNNLVLPLLDGLDEVDALYRNECVECINAYQTSRNQSMRPLVVCSRSEEYMALTSTVYMNVHSAVTVLPLAPSKIDEYLSGVQGNLEAVVLALQEDPVLQKLATVPLMLNVLIVAYEGETVQSLSMENRPEKDRLEARRQKIFAAYIERVLSRRRLNVQYSESLTIQQLSWLARRLKQHRQKVFYLEELQADWLLARWARLVYHTVTGLIFGIVVFLAFGAFVGLFIEPIFVLKAGVIVGGAIGIIGGLLIGLRDGPASSIQPTEGIAWSFENFRVDFFPRLKRGLRHLFGALIFGILVGLIGGLFIGLKIGLIGGSFVGVFVWLIAIMREKSDLAEPASKGIKGVLESFQYIWLFLLSGGLIAGVRAGLIAGISNKLLNVELRSAPNQGIKRSARYAAFFGLTFALIFGPLFGLIGWLLIGPSTILHFVLSGVISSTLLSALVFGGEACTKHWILRLLLHVEEGVPWNYPQFLDYTAERILLYKTGGGYIFIHDLLLEHFAMRSEE